jgi:hypothetical protein
MTAILELRIKAGKHIKSLIQEITSFPIDSVCSTLDGAYYFIEESGDCQR